MVCSWVIAYDFLAYCVWFIAYDLWVIAYGFLFVASDIVRYLISKLPHRRNAWQVQGGIQICFRVLGSITYLTELWMRSAILATLYEALACLLRACCIELFFIPLFSWRQLEIDWSPTACQDENAL